jgi:hypothetical protein
LCFKELGLELTPALTRADLTVLLREAAPQVAALHSVHGCVGLERSRSESASEMKARGPAAATAS